MLATLALANYVRLRPEIAVEKSEILSYQPLLLGPPDRSDLNEVLSGAVPTSDGLVDVHQVVPSPTEWTSFFSGHPACRALSPMQNNTASEMCLIVAKGLALDPSQTSLTSSNNTPLRLVPSMTAAKNPVLCRRRFALIHRCMIQDCRGRHRDIRLDV